MVHLDCELADFKSFQDFTDDREYLRIGDHQGIVSSNIKITLVKFSESALAHLRLIASVNFCNVEALDLLNALGSDVTSERNCKVISEGKQLSSLILKIIDKLAVLTVFSSQSLLQFKDRGIDLTCSMFMENSLNFVEGLLTDSHLQWCHVARTFGALGQTTFLVSNL